MINNPILNGKTMYAWAKYDTYTPYKTVNGNYVYSKPEDLTDDFKYKTYKMDVRNGSFILDGYESIKENQSYHPSTSETKIYKYANIVQSSSSTTKEAWMALKSVISNPIKGDLYFGIVLADTESAYPADGVQNGYWYTFIGEVDGEPDFINTGDGFAYIWEKYDASPHYAIGGNPNGSFTQGDDIVGDGYEGYTFDNTTGIFTLTGEVTTNYPRYYATTSQNKIYRLQNTQYGNAYFEKIAIQQANVKGDTRYENVASRDKYEYPEDGEQNGYWYVLIGKASVENSGSAGSGIDTNDATATTGEILNNYTAYVKGKKITGTLEYYPRLVSDESNAAASGYIYNADEVEFVEGQNNRIRLTKNIGTTEEVAFLDGSQIGIQYLASNFGNATAADVAKGKTFTSINGLKVTGTAQSSAPTLQSKTATPSTSQQTITPDSGYDGLSSVTVNAIPTATLSTPTIAVDNAGKITATVQQASAGYVAAGSKSAAKQLTTRGAATITPGTSDLTIASGVYLSGNQTIKGDANLIAGNIKKGVSIFGVVGSFDGSGGSGGASDNNCEAYHITSASAKLNFKTTGTVKVWGYGYQQGGYMGTHYSFVGDGYYSGGYGTPRKTTASFSINADGTLSGLPNNLTSVDLLVTIGV